MSGTDDCCEYGTIVPNQAACSSTPVKYCNWGTCVGGNGWECSGGGGCYAINTRDTEADCRSKSGTVVDCCPADTRPPSSNFPSCSVGGNSSSSGGSQLYCDYGPPNSYHVQENLTVVCHPIGSSSDCDPKYGKVVTECGKVEHPHCFYPSVNGCWRIEDKEGQDTCDEGVAGGWASIVMRCPGQPYPYPTTPN
jgi:hypothetical protein